MIGLEDELARIREENDVGKDVYKEKMEKLGKRLHVMKQRYDSLEKRRTLEVEGFKNDIKILRGRLKDVEKQLFKVCWNFFVYNIEIFQVYPHFFRKLAFIDYVQESNTLEKCLLNMIIFEFYDIVFFY